jgi:glycosyltransferase involved in cell wall biosynthesis
MRVLLVHGRYRSVAPSGENNVVDQEGAALGAAGNEVHTFERNSDDIAGWSLLQKAALPARSLWNGEVRRDLSRRIAGARPDVVHVHNTFPLLSASVLYACRDAGVPVVATLHNYKLLCASGDFFRDGEPCHDCIPKGGGPALRHGCYRGSRVATLPVVAATAAHRSAWQQLVSAYIFISAAQRDRMSSLDLPPDRVFVKHNFVPSIPAPDRVPEHMVAYLGRLDAAKGLPLLMRSWDAYRAMRPHSALRLVVAGGGPLEPRVRAWAAADRTVEVAGLLRREQASALLGQALAAVVPSQWEETFGLVAVEAMAAGVAPLAPRSGSFPELISDGKDGVLFKAGDPASLAQTLDAVDRDPNRFVRLGRRGRTTYEQRFTPKANVEQLVEIYRYAMANTVAHPAAPAPSG